MPDRESKANDSAVQTSLAFLGSLLDDYHPRDFAVRLWDGTVWEAESAGWLARFTLVLKHPGALRSMFWPPGELALAEAYAHGDFDIEGRIEEVFPLADRLLDRRRNTADRLRHGSQLLSLPSVRRGDRPYSWPQGGAIAGQQDERTPR